MVVKSAMADVKARLEQMTVLAQIYNKLVTDLDTVDKTITNVCNNCESVWNGSACKAFTEHTDTVKQQTQAIRNKLQMSQKTLLQTIQIYNSLETKNVNAVTESIANFETPAW